MSLKLKNLNLQLQNVVYLYKCDLCDVDYVGFTSRHLHQRVEEHKRSVIGNHVREQHGKEPSEITKNFRVLRKCSNKFDCLIFLKYFIWDLQPKLNKQSDSIRAKLFTFIVFYSFNSFHLLFTLHFRIRLFFIVRM